MVELLSFDEAMKDAVQHGGKRHILLGNGFSIGAHAAFSYGTLYEQAKAAGLPGHVIEMFGRYGTTNFEEILKLLDEGQWLAQHYKLQATDPGLDMAADYARVRDALVEAISRSHPEIPDDVGDAKLLSCRAFLEPFDDVLTTNYDLLLYWSSVKTEPFGFEDGFGREPDTPDRYCIHLPASTGNRHLYFLHGALHLTTVGGEVRKFVWNTTGERLIDQVRVSLAAKEYPLVVSEGTPQDKLRRIEASSYLSWVFRRFENFQGSLFTYGWGLSEQDDHLLDAIAKNVSLSRLYVGVYGDPESETNTRLIARAHSLANRRNQVLNSGRTGRRRQSGALEVKFFDASTANVWNGP